jgi:flagellin
MSDISLSKAVRSNLLSLQNTATMMSKTQERLATGNKVNSALDNPTNFFTASSLNSRAADMGNLLDSMASGIKVIEAANNGLTALTKNLESMQSTLRQARQDKSFQTKSFDITADSVINLSGGQFGNSVSEISLASATIEGTKASVGTTGTDAYLGPQSVDGAATGASARSVIDLGGGFTTGDVFTVAGEEVTVGADATAQGVADAISTALAGSEDTAGKYTVSVGTGDVAGKIVIETVDTSAAAAAVNFDPDSDPLTGIGSATKGTTTFNYSAITSSIEAGGQTVETGSNFNEFVANLQTGAEEGGYTVAANAETGEITLTSTAWAGAAPEVNGVATNSGFVPGSKATTEFQLASTDNAGTDELTHDQSLSVSGIADPIELTAGMDSDAVLGALEANEDLAAAYDIEVAADLTVTLTEKTVGGAAAPSVTSSQVAAPASPSFQTGVGGEDFAGAGGDAAVAALDGTDITLTAANGDSKSYSITGASDVDALTAALTDEGFTVEATADGFSFTRMDGEAFTIEVSGGSASALGLGSSTISVAEGTLEQTAGITGGTAATLVGTGTTDLTDDLEIQALLGTQIDLDDGAGNTSTFTIGAATTKTELEAALSQNGFSVEATATGLNISRADGTNFSMSVSGGPAADLGFGSTSVTSTDGNPPAVTETDGVADTAAVNGKVEVNGSTGASVDTVAAQTDQFTVSYDGKTANISISGVKGGSGPDAIDANALDINRWQSATIESVNNQLETAGITGVEAAFDTDGKFSLVAKTAEAETLAISGRDSVALFGTDSVKTGIAEKSELNATKTIDKFVELINRDHGTQVRASNDNGKLRIENLSTQALDIGVDTNGNDVISTMSVDGNSYRENLSKQFNELRDQMDKLSDDASFNGINLLRGDKLTITFNENGSSSINIQAKDKADQPRSINASSLGIESLDAMDLDSDAGIDAFLSKITSALSDIRSQASSFGSKLSSVENRQTFTKSMINTLQTGAANLTLADMNEEAANLLALQTRQSLSSSALSMASQADQSILQLLR